jgi:MoxR-like ATPase
MAASSTPATLSAWESALGGVLRGKAETVRFSLVSLLARGHLLIEDVPGVGKTTLAHALARSVQCRMQRLQFTSDLLPSDILGVSIFNGRQQAFEFKPGPVFTNFLVADEINRATPKAQSALLEAMNEGQVSVDGETHLLPRPFMVIATQNPLDFQGTFPLPESQLDRFLMRLEIGYPDREAERRILARDAMDEAARIPELFTPEQVLAMQDQARSVTVDDSVADYLLTLVGETRNHPQLSLGVSPRGAQALYRSAQALALLEERAFVIPEDIKRLFVAVCGHRVVAFSRSGAASRPADGTARILTSILDQTPVPV